MSKRITKELIRDRSERLARITVKTLEPLNSHPNASGITNSLGNMFYELLTQWLIDDNEDIESDQK